MAKDNALGAILVIALGAGLVFAGLDRSRQQSGEILTQAIDRTIRDQGGLDVPVRPLVPDYSPGSTSAGTAYQPVDYIYSALEQTGQYTEQQLVDANAVAGLYGYWI